VREADIDGYRCDVAGYVPTDFWNQARLELDAIKPVFMLAEWESRDLHARAFDMTYAWSWYDTVHRITMGHADVSNLFPYYTWSVKSFPRDGYRMMFVSNHDKNAWEGTQFEQFGAGLEAAIVLTVVGEGMPLIYNGQEAGNPRRLAFFERDPIEWREHPIGELYQRLFVLRKANSALWNGVRGARMVHVVNSAPTAIFSFVRQNERDKVFVVINFSAQEQSVRFEDGPHHGHYTDYLSGEATELTDATPLTVAPWGYHVFVQ
jgi:glycosidase